MSTKSIFWSRIVEIYQQVFSMLKKNPTILFLFFTIGILDFIALIVLFLAPSAPVSYVLAPIIRTFWSDYFLHYPNNFLLLPKLFGHAHFLISTVVGVFITGLVVKQIEAEVTGQKISTVKAAAIVIRKYFSLVLVWLVSYGIFTLSLKGILPLLPSNIWIHLAGGFFLGLLIQSIFLFLIPALILVKQGFVKSLLEGFRFGIKNVLLTGALIAVPTFLALLVSFTKLFTPRLVRIQPEIVLWVLAGGIVISLFIDVLITSSATLLFLKGRTERS
jgi:hypothetical protein